MCDLREKIIHDDILEIIHSNIIDWNVFNGKTVLISGATGMLPSYIVLTLLYLVRDYNFKIEIICLVRNEEKARLLFDEFKDCKLLKFIIQDVFLPLGNIERADFIIHAASPASPQYYGADPVGTAKANIIGTINLLELGIKTKCESFLFCSSSTIYGNFENTDLFLKETDYGAIDSTNLWSCYAESKKMGENLCVDYFQQYNVPIRIARIFHTLGPTLNFSDGRAFSDLCKSVINNENLILRSDGTAVRTFAYITDTIKGLFKILINGKTAEAYNVGSAKNKISIRALAELLCVLYKEKKLSVETNIPKRDFTYVKMKNPVNSIVPDLNKLKTLGWNESKTIEECFLRTIDSNLNRS